MSALKMPRVYQPDIKLGEFQDTLVWFCQNQLKDRRTVIHCSSIAHSKAVADALNKAGVRTMHVDAKMDRIDRADRLNALSSRQVQCLTHCTTLLDSPLVDADACIMMTQTSSKMRALAQIKMIMRAADPVVVDMAGNFNRLSLFAELDRIISTQTETL